VSPDGILVVDHRAQIISVNRRFGEIFDVPARLLAAKENEPLWQWVVGQVSDSAAFLSRVHYLYAHPEESSYDEVVLADGRVLDRYSAPMNRADGAYAGRVWFFRDITERKRAEKTVRGSEERFRLVVEAAPDAILLYDVFNDRLISANKAAERLFGLPREQIVEYGPRHFYVPEQPDAQPLGQSFANHNKRALAGEEITCEQRIRNATGEERLCRVTLVRIPSPGRRLLRASFVDITDQKAAELAMLRLNRTLRTLSRGNEVLVRADSEPKLLSAMCQVIVDTGGYRLAWVGVAENDAAKSVTPAAWAGEVGDYLETVQITWADEPHGRGPTGSAIRCGEVQMSQNFAADPPWRRGKRRHSSAAWPRRSRCRSATHRASSPR
jgi:PAS domain S-box-containing protein